MIKLMPYILAALAASVALVGVQQYRIKSKNKEITRLEFRIENAELANRAALDTIRELQTVNEQCALDNLHNSKLNEALSSQHQAHAVTLNQELKDAKEQIKALGQNHCANNRIGDAFGLLPKN